MAGIVLFDGVCNLCNATVQLLIGLDKHNRLKFTSLQSDFGQKILKKTDLDPIDLSTFIYLKDGKVFSRSDAAIQVFSDLGSWWKPVKLFLIFPGFLRNGVYDFISRNRYKWFGKREKCMIPTSELKDKFID